MLYAASYPLISAWVALLVKHLTLDFSLGHDLGVRGFEPPCGTCANSLEPAWDSLFFPFSLSLPCSCSLSLSLSLSQNK